MNLTESTNKDASKTFETTLGNCKDGPFEVLKTVRANNANTLVIGHLNINSIRKKFEMLSSMIKDNINVLMVSETKLDSSFPQSHFIIEGCTPPCTYDRNSHGGGILLFARVISAKKIVTTTLKDFEVIFLDLNLHNKKKLL